MKLAVQEDSGRDGKTARFTVIDGAAGADTAPSTRAIPERGASYRALAPVVRRPVAPGRAPMALGVVAEANLQVKRYHDAAAPEKACTVTLHAASAAPAALLAALADAASRIEDLGRDGTPDDRVILTVAIRR